MNRSPEGIANFRQRLRDKGEVEVSEDLAFERYGPDSSPDAKLAKDFLREVQEAKDAAAQGEESAQRTEIVRLARQANNIAKTANRRATVGSTVATLIAMAALVRLRRT